MTKKRAAGKQSISLKAFAAHYPVELFAELVAAARGRGHRVYLVGGALRDWLQGGRPNDLDCAVDSDSSGYLRQVAQELGQGVIVELGDPIDDTCRLVLPGLVIDAAGFRGGAEQIEDDLVQRDVTFNAMAIDLAALVDDGTAPIIDPLDGFQDLRAGIVRACPQAFSSDPLRMLRVIRFAAQFDFVIEWQTLYGIADQAERITRSAGERIGYECEQIMRTPRSFAAFNTMVTCGLLAPIAPELQRGDGVGQPRCHHLDVLQHNLETLARLEGVFSNLKQAFPDSYQDLEAYAFDRTNRIVIKWAALFHDVGKPVAKAVHEKDGERITFYRHDEHGAELFYQFARRLGFGTRTIRRVSSLIAMHMHPFHLGNVRRRDGRISRRALLKLCRRAGDDLPGLFLLAMADTLAGQGTERPEGIEADLARLHKQVATLHREVIEPVLSGPKLLTGDDLIATLGLTPGPLFRELLDAVETAAVEGTIRSREEALAWVRHYLQTAAQPDRKQEPSCPV